MRQALALKDELPIKSHATTKSNRSIYGTFIVEGNGQVDLNQNDIVVDRFGSALGLVTDTSNGKTNVVGLDALKDPIDLTLLNGQISLKTIGLSRYVLVAKIPRETEIEVGDVAIVTGTNIKVGSVVDFSKDEKEPFKEVYIRMSGKIERTQVVGIIANN
jgi:cell shape-determining protein MreC